MILVVGATGFVGGMVAADLARSQHPVRVLVRPGSDSRHLLAAGAEPVTADLKDPASLRRACAGTEAVITTATAAQRGGADTVDSVDLAGNQALVDAAVAEGVERFVFVSALGASSSHRSPRLRAKAATEAHLRASPLAWTVLSPNVFMDVWFPLVVGEPAAAGRPVRWYGPGDRHHSFVAARDVAAYAVATLFHSAAAGQMLAIGGPQALTWHDVVRLYEQRLGRELEVRPVRAGEEIPGLAPPLAELLAGLDTYDSHVDMSEPARVYGVRSTPAEEVVSELVGRGAG